MRALSVGLYGNSKIDIDASNQYDWCDGIWLEPIQNRRGLPITPKDIEQNYNINYSKYDCVLLWHQNITDTERYIINQIKKYNPNILIIGNQHGYNKSIREMVDIHPTPPPEADFWNYWGQYNLDRYQELYHQDAEKFQKWISLGSIRHDYLYKNFKWEKSHTNKKFLVIHEPNTFESWGDPIPLGSNELSQSIVDELIKNQIPFDFKVHPNWPNFISNNETPMWKPPESVRCINLELNEIIEYEAIIASWSSIQLDALAMGMPVINIDYEYPKENDSEWGPGRHKLLKSIPVHQLAGHIQNEKYLTKSNSDLIQYFVGNLGEIGNLFKNFIINNKKQNPEKENNIAILLKRILPYSFYLKIRNAYYRNDVQQLSFFSKLKKIFKICFLKNM